MEGIGDPCRLPSPPVPASDFFLKLAFSCCERADDGRDWSEDDCLENPCWFNPAVKALLELWTLANGPEVEAVESSCLSDGGSIFACSTANWSANKLTGLFNDFLLYAW